jgi:hypothetical protein
VEQNQESLARQWAGEDARRREVIEILAGPPRPGDWEAELLTAWAMAAVTGVGITIAAPGGHDEVIPARPDGSGIGGLPPGARIAVTGQPGRWLRAAARR